MTGSPVIVLNNIYNNHDKSTYTTPSQLWDFIRNKCEKNTVSTCDGTLFTFTWDDDGIHIDNIKAPLIVTLDKQQTHALNVPTRINGSFTVLHIEEVETHCDYDWYKKQHSLYMACEHTQNMCTEHECRRLTGNGCNERSDYKYVDAYTKKEGTNDWIYIRLINIHNKLFCPVCARLIHDAETLIKRFICRTACPDEYNEVQFQSGQEKHKLVTSASKRRISIINNELPLYQMGTHMYKCMTCLESLHTIHDINNHYNTTFSQCKTREGLIIPHRSKTIILPLSVSNTHRQLERVAHKLQEHINKTASKK